MTWQGTIFHKVISINIKVLNNSIYILIRAIIVLIKYKISKTWWKQNLFYCYEHLITISLLMQELSNS